MRRHAKAVVAISVMLLGILGASALAAYVPVGTFSGPGNGDGELETPGRAVVEQSTGNLFVVDSDNDRVQVFAPNDSGGADYLTQFGGGQLSEPWGIAIDVDAGQTSVYVADAGNDRIVKYASDEAATPVFSDDNGFTSPAKGSGSGEVDDFRVALAVDPSTHDLLVADNANGLIQRFEGDGSFDSAFDGSNGATAFTGLLDLAVAPDGDIYVIDANGPDIGEQEGTSQALRYSAAGAYQATLTPVGPNQRPATIAVDPSSGDVAVSGEQDAVYRDESPTLYLFDSSDTLLSSPAVSAQFATFTGLAFASADSRLYAVLDHGSYFGTAYGSAQIQVFENLFAPEVSIDAVDTGTVTGSDARFSGSVDPNGTATSWHFEYRVVGSPGWTSSPSEEAGSGADPVAVSFDATGLEPLREYEVRLGATSAGGSSATEAPHPTFTTDALPPEVTTLAAGAVRATEARIRGAVDPRNSQTEYWFEWGTQDCLANPCTSVPLGEDADAGSGNGQIYVFRQLTGLSPETTYHFRLLAKSAAGTSAGDGLSFTTPAASTNCANEGAPGVGFLPDCRAWEMVSPPNKNGGDVVPFARRLHASRNGNAVAFTSLAGFADVKGFAAGTEYLARRSSDPDPGNSGWSTRGITPPQESQTLAGNFIGVESRYEPFSDDLSTGIFRAWSPLTDDPYVAETNNLYLRQGLGSDSVADLLLTGCPLCVETEEPIPPGILSKALAQVAFAGASDDFSHVIFEKGFLPLTKDAAEAPSESKLYESVNGTVRLAGILPTAKPSPVSIPGQGVDKRYLGGHEISSDGSRVIFSDNGTGLNTGNLYMRINGRSTVQLNASELTFPEGPQPARYWDGSNDGSRVFFTASEKLYMWERREADEEQSVAIDATGGTFTLSFNEAQTEPLPFDAHAADVQDALEALITIKPGNVAVTGGPGSAGAATPYEVTFTDDFNGANVAQLAADGSALTGGAGTATVSTSEPVENLSVLAEPVQDVIGASEDGSYIYFKSSKQLVPGAPPPTSGAIFAWHEGSIFLVALAENWGPDSLELVNGANYTLDSKQVFLTGNGTQLIFALHNFVGPTGYVQGKCKNNFLNICRQIYLYDLSGSTPAVPDISCVSCNPSGAPGTADPTLNAQAASGGLQVTGHEPRTISEDGRYAFFTTAERLVDADINGQSDAYVYDSKTAEPYLLSSGESKYPSYFMEASADGADAFFITRERLSGWDTDTSFDLYDGRARGGFPEPPPPPPSCQGDACQPLPLALSDPTPSSSSFRGQGDPAANRKARKPRCRYGRHRVKARNGKTRCAKRKKGKRANSNRRAS